MADFDRVVGFDWDEGKAAKSADKHGVAREEAEQVFSDPRLVVSDDVRHGEGEPRFHALGSTGAARRLHVTFTLRRLGELIRVISARPMSRRERRIYGDED